MKLLINETGGSRLLHKYFQLTMTSKQYPFSETLGGVPLHIVYGDATNISKNLTEEFSTEEFEKF